MTDRAPLAEGTLSFTIESRILRELGERLVKRPEVALVELIKNAYDADATTCLVDFVNSDTIRVVDDGIGMTLEDFTQGWMRIGTSSKVGRPLTPRHKRSITGEKGIGRFAVRFLGRRLQLRSIAFDGSRGFMTVLSADFNWPRFDLESDLTKAAIPYRLAAADDDDTTGTALTITRLRSASRDVNLRAVRTGSLGIVSPLRTLLRTTDEEQAEPSETPDAGFQLLLRGPGTAEEEDLAEEVLNAYVLRGTITYEGNTAVIRVYRRGVAEPAFEVRDHAPGPFGPLSADIRFFPRRSGTFTNLKVDGKTAYRWLSVQSGVAVFDRGFRVQPYGASGDDWLRLQYDAARNTRAPRSELAMRHFPMTESERADTAENWMLRLPQSAQLIGVVELEGSRQSDIDGDAQDEGLIASADREGFVANEAFSQMQNLVRGAVEAIAFMDRALDREAQEAKRQQEIQSIRDQSAEAIRSVVEDPTIPTAAKRKIVATLTDVAERADQQDRTARTREQRLETLSLLGVVAGFMTHEFGVALAELREARGTLRELATTDANLGKHADEIDQSIEQLQEFVRYTSAYVRGARDFPKTTYKVKPRVQQAIRIFGDFATERDVVVILDIPADLEGPLVPVSLYNGIALNLFTNALKALTSSTDTVDGTVAFRAWNDRRRHYLEVADTGVGIPKLLRERVFEPLYSTTDVEAGPLGSGMGLGLALVRRASEAFGGKAAVVDPPPGYRTAIRVELPLNPSA